jgi:hypothetical protein
MSLRRTVCLASLALVLAIVRIGFAQEGGPNDPNNAPPPPGVDKFYWDLSHSKDRVTKSMAERYIAMIKAQEWSDLSGKFTTIARYVKHEPDLSMVTIESGKGRGTDRVTKEITVPVDKLSKTCQSRVRQIDAMQKKLKELAAKSTEHGGSPGAPMADERGAEPGAQVAGPADAPPMAAAAPEPDPSASEPDPLGFAELPDVSPAGPDAGPGSAPPPANPPGS